MTDRFEKTKFVRIIESTKGSFATFLTSNINPRICCFYVVLGKICKSFT